MNQYVEINIRINPHHIQKDICVCCLLYPMFMYCTRTYSPSFAHLHHYMYTYLYFLYCSIATVTATATATMSNY